MKKTKFYIAKDAEKLRTDIEWLSDVNTLLKTKKHSETLYIYDYFRYDTDIYIITEVCLCDLQKAIDDRAKAGLYFKEEEVRKALAQILQAVLLLHSLSIIHSDLKPSNIFVRKAEPLELCLADFGASIDLTIGLEERGNL